jgi:hypothetical protein
VLEAVGAVEGVSPEDITTVGVTLTAKYSRPDTNRESVIEGYTFSQQLQGAPSQRAAGAALLPSVCPCLPPALDPSRLSSAAAIQPPPSYFPSDSFISTPFLPGLQSRCST